MTDPIFARTRHNYDSYGDFWTLVDLAGFKTCFVDEIDDKSTDTYIFTPFNGEIFGVQEKAKRHYKLIWWNLERPDGNPKSINEVVSQALTYADHAWSSCKYVCSLESRFQHVVLGGDKRLNPWWENYKAREIKYDFTHQSYAWGRRAVLYNQIKEAGFKEGPSCYGEMRTAVLSSSRLMLNAQQYPAPVFAPLRAVLAAAFALPFVSESMWDPYPLENGHDIVMGPIDTLVMHMKLMDPEKCAKMGANLYEKLCLEWTFRRGVEEGLKNL